MTANLAPLQALNILRERADSHGFILPTNEDAATTVRQALRDQEAEIARLRELLRSEATLLRAWAKESREGGWSTHQVNPMNRRADEITTHLGATQHD